MAPSTELTAEAFERDLRAMQSDDELRKIQGYFKTGRGEYGEGDVFIGVRMGAIFDLAKAHMAMDLPEIEKLLESPIHEMRVGGVSIMAFQAADRKTSEVRRRELFELYLRRHDRINNWDLVDRAAPAVLGGWLSDKPRDVLYEMARNGGRWERRSAMFATLPFLRKGQADDTFALAEILIDDPEDLMHKMVGGMLREAGRKHPERLEAFLDRHAATMPRTALRYAVEHFEPARKAHYMGLKAKA